jgi:MYXO-CTERM domain-containing protein
VLLADADAANAHFTAPSVTDSTAFTFALRTDDGALLSAPARVAVTVDNGGGCAYGGGARSSLWGLLAVGLAISAATRRRRAAR